MGDTELKIAKLIEICSKSNIPFQNLLHNDFLPEEVHKLYLELIKEEESFIILEKLSNGISIDQRKISKYYLWDIAVIEKENLVLETYPEVSQLIDNDGLIEVPYNSDLNKDGFRYKDHYLVFENAFSHNFNFTRWIIKNWKNEYALKLPISMRLLGLLDTRRDMFLKSHWEGPKDINHVKKSLSGKEVIVKGNNNLNIPLLDKTEFMFTKRENMWHLQIEELLPLEGLFFSKEIAFRDEKLCYYTKYLHAIVNEDFSCCIHLDGALRVYETIKNFKNRNSVTLKDTVKDSCKKYKLFRMDSKVGVSSFQEIVGLFFVGNPYVIEFFEGKSNYTNSLEVNRGKMLEANFKSNNLSEFISQK